MYNGKLKYHFMKNYMNQPLPFGDILLCQIGMAYCKSTEPYPDHKHNDIYELSVCLSGKGRIFADGKPCDVCSGDIFVSLPFETHRIDSDPEDPLKYIFFSFSVSNKEFAEELCALTRKFKTPYDRVIRNDNVISLLQSAIMELSLSLAHDKLYTSLLFTQTLIQLIRTLKHQNHTFHMPTGKEEFCFQIMDYIDKNLEEMNSLVELADYFKYDYGYISYTFSKTTTQTLSSFYRQKRLEKACNMLKNNYSVGRVAALLHWSDIYSFSKSFKKTYNMSPSEYKKLHAEKQ